MKNRVRFMSRLGLCLGSSYTIVVNQTTTPLSDPNYIAKLVSGKWSVVQ